MTDVSIIDPNFRNPEGSWQPIEGERTARYLGNSGEMQDRLRSEAFRVLGKCIDPRGDAKTQHRSQLVLGQVQSGKTSNMKAVIALATDNGYPLTIILTGINRILDSQTSKDLKHSLRSYSPQNGTPWYSFQSVEPGSDSFIDSVSAMQSLVRTRDWYESGKFAALSTDNYPLCIFLLKNSGTMNRFIDNLEINKALLNQLPVLIIDDEADQAGANTGSDEQSKSATNEALARLRGVIPRHSYLLYTATPQAPLLSDLINVLSPEYVTVLEAGEGYVGVGDLFPLDANKLDIKRRFAHVISSADIQIVRDHDTSNVPLSLSHALASYLVRDVIARSKTFSIDKGFTVMLLQTSQPKRPMENTKRWIESILKAWDRIFADVSDPDYCDLVGTLFIPEIEAVRFSCKASGIEVEMTNEQIIEEVRSSIEFSNGGLKRIKTRVVNSDTADLGEDDWIYSRSWILIGGNKLGRGFRIPNLLVTYMPRSTVSGESNLDTVQQRGRFFGYRRKIFPLLKGWFPQEIIDTYMTYRDHDSHLRSEMKRIDRLGMPLKEWERELFSNVGLSPTRRNVRKLFLRTSSAPPGKVTFRQAHFFSVQALKGSVRNRQLLQDMGSRMNLVSGTSIFPGAGEDLVGNVSLSEFIDFLQEYMSGVSPSESQELQRILTHLSAIVGIYQEAFERGETPRLPEVSFYFYRSKLGKVDSGIPYLQEISERGPLLGASVTEKTTTTGFGTGRRPAFENCMKDVICEVMTYRIYDQPVSSPSKKMVIDEVPGIRISFPDLGINTLHEELR